MPAKSRKQRDPGIRLRVSYPPVAGGLLHALPDRIIIPFVLPDTLVRENLVLARHLVCAAVGHIEQALPGADEGCRGCGSYICLLHYLLYFDGLTLFLPLFDEHFLAGIGDEHAVRGVENGTTLQVIILHVLALLCSLHGVDAGGLAEAEGKRIGVVA